MKLYVIRHGESETNQRGCYTGWAQVSLTEKGKADARSIRPLLKDVPFDKIYASDLIRAKQTAENALPGCTYEENELLREINVGNIAQKPLTVLNEEQKKRTATEGYRDYDGESREEFNRRIRTFLAQIENLDHEYVAAFCHAGWLRCMLDLVVGVTLPRKAIGCSNCTVAIFEYKNGGWQLHSWINP